MKRSMFVFAVMACVATLTIVGCSKPSPEQVAAGLKLAGEQGSFYGLKKWAEKNPAAANETATKLKASIDNTLLPYLNGADLPSSDLVHEFVDSTLLDGLQDEVKDAIIAASYALDAALPVPSADKLNPQQVEYIKSFLTGLSNGCGKFLAKSEAPATPKFLKDLQKDKKQTKWLTGKVAKKVK